MNVVEQYATRGLYGEAYTNCYSDANNNKSMGWVEMYFNCNTYRALHNRSMNVNQYHRQVDYVIRDSH